MVREFELKSHFTIFEPKLLGEILLRLQVTSLRFAPGVAGMPNGIALRTLRLPIDKFNRKKDRAAHDF